MTDREGVKEIPIHKKYLTTCIVLALMLCLAQIMGNTLLILACLAFYLVLAAWCCSCNFTLPILLFFLPWSPLLKMNPTGYSFYTFAMVLICLISIVKKRFYFRNYQLKAGILILFITLFSKMLDGSFLAFNYIAFIMMIVLFPGVKEEWRDKKYDFYQIVCFFAVGVIIASLCALFFAEFANIRKYIKVDGFATIIRRSGFYGDANFYTAHILSALGGALTLILQEKKKSRMVFLGIVIVFLLYCGFLSASKSFAIVAACAFLFWIMALLTIRGRAGLKVTLIAFLIIGIVYIATSALFSGLIEVLIMRFSFTKDLDTFTTGRIGLWGNYIKELLGNAKVFFLGKGFTDVKVNGRASHNTIIQIFFQFGLLGAPILIYWSICFFREARNIQKEEKKFDLKKIIVVIGSFLPWMAIDVLFADEFFLLQWYMLVAINYLRANDDVTQAETGSYGGELWTRE